MIISDDERDAHSDATFEAVAEVKAISDATKDARDAASRDGEFEAASAFEGALARAQREVSTAIFFDDVAAAVVAGGVALGAAQQGALWLREIDAQNLSAPLGAFSRNSTRTSEPSKSAAAQKNAENETSETAWICVLSHAMTPAGTVSSLRQDEKRDLHRVSQSDVSQSDTAQSSVESAFLAAQMTPSVRAATQGQTSTSDAPFVETSEVANALEVAETPPKRREMAWSLRENGRSVGVLQLGWENETILSSGANRVLDLFCEYAATALSNARLFDLVEGAKREWQSTFDGLIDGVCIEQPDGVILRANRVAAQIFGRAETAMPGSLRDELSAALPFYEELRPLEPTLGDLSGRAVRSRKFRFGAPSRIILETIFSLQVEANTKRRAQPLTRGDDERRVVRILRDITEQHRLEEQLIQSEKLAALGELISGVAHELNNPLTTVAGYAQLLQDDVAIPASARRHIEYIYEEATRASRIVANLLAFARREEPRRESVDVNASLRAIVDMRSYQLQSENVRLSCRYADDLPPVVGDAHQLQQVFLNVINNAQQAMQAWRGGGHIEISTERVLVGGAAGVLISIRDNGPGIAPDHLRRLFDPFWTTKRVGEGTGLGMSLSLGIVSRHNGRIWAESTLGRGARFLIELAGEPNSANESNAANSGGETVSGFENTADFADETLAPNPISSTRFASDDSANDDSANDDETSIETEGAQILVVDDEENVIFLISEVLGLDGHEITPAFNGGEALALLQERDFDLILSDVRMPAVGGPTFFEILQTTRPDLLPRVVFVTGDTMSRSTQDFLRLAARPMLAKPFAPERLRALVQEQLNRNR